MNQFSKIVAVLVPSSSQLRVRLDNCKPQVGGKGASLTQSRCVMHHKFSPEINEKIKPLYILDNWHGPVALLKVYSLIILSILTPAALSSYVGWWPSYLASVLLIGCEMRALATVFHEAVHRTIARSPWLNYTLGTFGSGYLIIQSWSAYDSTHVFEHHTHLGDKLRDPDYKFHISQGVYRPTHPLRFILINFVAPLFFIKSPAKIVDLVKNRLFSSQETWNERWMRVGYCASLVGFIYWLGYGQEFLAFWIIPLVTVFPIVNWYNEFFEHYPYVATGTTDIEMSRNRWPGLISGFLTCQLNENYHLTHHLKERVPFWNLPAAHAILMEDSTYSSLQTREFGLVIPLVSGTPSVVLNIIGLVSRNRHG